MGYTQRPNPQMTWNIMELITEVTQTIFRNGHTKQASNKLGPDLGLHSFGGQEHNEAQNIGGQVPPSPETFHWQLPTFDSVPSWIPGILHG